MEIVYDEYGNAIDYVFSITNELFERNFHARHVRNHIRFHREEYGQDPTFEQVAEFVRDEYVEHPCAGCDGRADGECETCDPGPAYCFLGETLVNQFAARFCEEFGIAVE